MHETLGEVGSRVSKLPFFDFLLASGGTIETFGPEYPLVMALSLVVFSILLSPTGLRGGLRKMTGEAAFGRSFRNVLFILVERFSIRSDCCSLVILVNDIYKERAEGRELGGCDGPGKYMRNESVDLVIECVQDESRTGMTMKAFVYQNNAFNKHLQAGQDFNTWSSQACIILEGYDSRITTPLHKPGSQFHNTCSIFVLGGFLIYI